MNIRSFFALSLLISSTAFYAFNANPEDASGRRAPSLTRDVIELLELKPGVDYDSHAFNRQPEPTTLPVITIPALTVPD